MAELGSAYATIHLDKAEFMHGMTAAKTGFAGLVPFFARNAGLIAASVAVAFGVAAIGKFVTASVRGAASFERAMSVVRAVSRATDEQFALLTDKATELGIVTKYTGVEIAAGMEALSRAGFDAVEVVAAMDGVAALAAASGISLADAALYTAGTIRGFSLDTAEATRIADIFALTTATADVTVADLGETFKYASPLARDVGVSVEKLAAMTGLLGSRMIRGSMAGTGLRMVFSRLLSPTTAFEDVLAELGLSMEELTDEQGELLHLSDIFRIFNAVGAESGDMMRIFGERAGIVAAILLEEGADAIESYTTELENAGGTAQEMADIQLATLSDQIVLLSGSWDTFIRLMGRYIVPILADFIRNVLRPIVDRMIVWAAETKGWITIWERIKTVIQDNIEPIRALGIAFGILFGPKMIGGMILLAVKMALIFGKLIIVGTVVTGVIKYWDDLKAAGRHLVDWFRNNFPGLVTLAKETWNEIKLAAEPFREALASLLGFFQNIWMGDWEAAWIDAETAAYKAWEGMKIIGRSLREIFAEVTAAIKTHLEGELTPIFENLKTLMDENAFAIETVATTFGLLISAKILKGIGALTIKVWALVAAMTVLAAKATVIKALPLLIAGTIAGIITAIRRPAEFMEAGEKIMLAIGGAIRRGMLYIGRMFARFGIGIVDYLKTLPDKFLDVGKQMMEGLIEGFAGMTTIVIDRIKAVGQAILAGIRGVLGIDSPAREMIATGRYIMEGLAEGLKEGQGEVLAIVEGIAEEIANTVEEAADTVGKRRPLPKERLREIQEISDRRIAVREFEAQLEEWAGVIVQAAGMIHNLLGRGVAALVGGVQAALAGDVPGMVSAVLSVFQVIKGALKEWIRHLEEQKKKIIAIIEFYANTFELAAMTIKQFADGLLNILGPVGEVFKAISTAFTSAIRMTTLEGLDLLAEGMKMLSDFVMALVGAFNRLIKESDAYIALQEEANYVWQAIGNLLGEFLWPLVAAIRLLREWLGIPGEAGGERQAMKVPADVAVERLRWAAAVPGQPVRQVPAWAGAVGETLAEGIRDLLRDFGIYTWTDLLNRTREIAKQVWGFITARLPEIINAVRESIMIIGQFFATHGITIEGIMDKIRLGIDWIVNHLPSFVAHVAQFLSDLISLGTQVWDWIWRNFPTWEDIQFAFTRFIDELDELLDFNAAIDELKRLRATIKTLQRILSIVMAAVAGAIVGGIVGALAASFPWLSWAIIPAGMAGALIGAAAGGLLAAIAGFVGGFERGGIVPGPVGYPQLAMVHGGEQIIPAGGKIVIENHLYVDGQEISTRLKQIDQRQIFRATGAYS